MINDLLNSGVIAFAPADDFDGTDPADPGSFKSDGDVYGRTHGRRCVDTAGKHHEFHFGGDHPIECAAPSASLSPSAVSAVEPIALLPRPRSYP